MKLTLTTSDAGRLTDHLLDVPEQATVADLAASLAPAPPDTGDPLPSPAPPPQVYLGDRALDGALPLRGSGIRDGALLGLGAPCAVDHPAQAWQPAPGDPVLIEVRHVGGPGAGRVWRLGAGSHEIGTARGCALRLSGGDAPEHGVWLTVGPDGEVTYLLPDGADEDSCGLRSLTPPPPVDPETGTPLTAEEPAGTRDGGTGGHSVAPGPDGLPPTEPERPPGHRPPPDDGAAEWPAFADLSLGEHLLRLSAPFQPDAAVNPSADGMAVEYNRPPRIAPHLDAETMRMQGPPSRPGPRAFPLLFVLAPLMMGLIMMGLFRSFYFMIFIFFSPMMAISNWIIGRRTGRKQYEESLRIYRLRRAALELELREAAVEERRLRNATFPDPATVLLTATGPSGSLWERRRRDPDRLTVRLGTLTRPSLRRIEDQARDANHRSVHWRLADVPYGLEMADLGVVGLAGPGATTRAIAAWTVAQSAVLHSPRDLRIVVLTSDENAEAWSWVRWLPHLDTGRGTSVVALGNDPESTAHRINELVADIQARTAAAASALGRTLLDEPDVLVIADGARRLRDVPGMVQVLKAGPPVHIYSLCVDEQERLLPEECTSVVTATGNHLAVRTTGSPKVSGVRADLVDTAWCEEVARALAPVRDVTLDGDSGLPDGVKLLGLIGQEPPDVEALLRSWERRPASTTFVLGAGYDGPLRLDLVRDGPHGLVAGTTGSGKSELLQTMIASLAAANRPDELAFVLIDYKGGSAFRECAELPHTLGMVTDLDGHLVQRALASLDAELRRREQLLADVEAKDHPDYRAKRARNRELPALPRLLIVIDEFATLVREVPDFVPGLISLAQRGRSLGLHLILATQRPGGSVSTDIKANTNLRIALRVTDKSESQDIIDSGDAVSISSATPGRALVRRGDHAPTPFQTAWVGAARAGQEPGEDEAPAQPGAVTAAARNVRGVELSWNRLGRPVELFDEDEETGADAAAPETATDLLALVETIRKATAALADHSEQASPWLPALPDVVTLDDLPQAPPTPPGRPAAVPYALLDLPSQQERRVCCLDFSSFGHLYVVGAPRSGRTQVLRTLAGSAARTLSAADLHLYAIDAAGGGLSALEALPHCGAVVSRFDTERLARLLGRLVRELTTRQEKMSAHDCASLTELRAALPVAERPAHLMLLIDGWDGISQMLDEYDGGRLFDEVTRLLREGAAAGIHLVASSERGLLGGRLSAHNDFRLLLRQSDKGDYYLAGMSPNRVPGHIPPGRGWHTPAAVETQIALLPTAGDGVPGQGSADQADALREIGRLATERDAALPAERRPFRVAEMPKLIGFQEAMEQVPETSRRPMWALLGIGGDEVRPLGFDFLSGGGSFAVVGPPGSGRSTALAAMSVSLITGGTSLVVLAPRESPLRKLADHGLAHVITDTDPSANTVEEALRAVGDKPVVVVADDSDLIASCGADKVLRKIASSGRDRNQGILIGGPSEGMSSMGWIGMVRRSRRGLLLGARAIGDGDIIGARISAEHIRTRMNPGRAWTAGPSGSVVPVQVPLTVLES
ncbi:FtsK/SpoIIIE domain-containing protein [Streptomyces catenulae]|uniref:FtsK/SpoIIIE domain-containing protein n=1 Tax=Streptomyces catenulae TaxID=66875 RepID=A0ABV2YZ55_9ACTN|nr:FtsK/SpoIIIE domain-containing protein [Streptomyces catenulae]